jgi:hypothetical protein
MSHLNTRNLEEQIVAASLGYDRDDTEILLACRIAGFANAVITYPPELLASRRSRFLHRLGQIRATHPYAMDEQKRLTESASDCTQLHNDIDNVAAMVRGTIPFWLDEPVDEAEQQAAEIAADTSWLDSGTQAALDYGDFDLGSRFTISGGEIIELDARTMGDDETIPF